MFIIMFTRSKRVSVISVRVDKKIKETLVKAGIDMAKEVKQFLQELAWRVEQRERLEKLDQSLGRIPSAAPGFAATSVREDREGH